MHVCTRIAVIFFYWSLEETRKCNFRTDLYKVDFNKKCPSTRIQHTHPQSCFTFCTVDLKYQDFITQILYMYIV